MLILKRKDVVYVLTESTSHSPLQERLHDMRIRLAEYGTAIHQPFLVSIVQEG